MVDTIGKCFMKKVVVAGAGKIGALVAYYLANSGSYEVFLVDRDFKEWSQTDLMDFSKAIITSPLDVTDSTQFSHFLKEKNVVAVISCLPFFCNVALAQLAKDANIHYFDLTEDIETTKAIRNIAEGASCAFIPQCGLAPGHVNRVAYHMMQVFDVLESAQLRVGALPLYSNNALHYALTWSTDGLINEYSNPCDAIEDGQRVTLPALENLETLEIDGVCYEAFNTSGGLGNLIEYAIGKINTLNYKTLRYPGHCEKMKFMLRDLDLKHDRATLKRLLEHALPTTVQDVVVIYVAVSGHMRGHFYEETYHKKFYGTHLGGHDWTAIQLTTSVAICAVVDLVLHTPTSFSGLIDQEQFSLQAVHENRFGQLLK